MLFCVYKAQNKANETLESDLILGVILWKRDVKRIAQLFRAYQTTGHRIFQRPEEWSARGWPASACVFGQDQPLRISRSFLLIQPGTKRLFLCLVNWNPSISVNIFVPVRTFKIRFMALNYYLLLRVSLGHSFDTKHVSKNSLTPKSTFFKNI